ncbi:MAG: hypothetical protein SLAVMIC_00174 [uncultured marine phage]|uniref:Uncharacterized protein n=1 Tax=uncultured marine phage TaxID=707152 RepID=A0A8D9CB54_9VIRU|nr:MAG: hypothetical protein SLAVMIC_00174 [uncultured marine phage]
MKIEFHLNKFDRELHFQIIDQDLSGSDGIYGTRSSLYKMPVFQFPSVKERFKGKPKLIHKGVFIKSFNSPDIEKRSDDNITIWLRGDRKNKDLRLVKKKFKTNEERDEMYNLILETFDLLKKGQLIKMAYPD